MNKASQWLVEHVTVPLQSRPTCRLGRPDDDRNRSSTTLFLCVGGSSSSRHPSKIYGSTAASHQLAHLFFQGVNHISRQSRLRSVTRHLFQHQAGAVTDLAIASFHRHCPPRTIESWHMITYPRVLRFDHIHCSQNISTDFTDSWNGETVEAGTTMFQRTVYKDHAAPHFSPQQKRKRRTRHAVSTRSTRDLCRRLLLYLPPKTQKAFFD